MHFTLRILAVAGLAVSLSGCFVGSTPDGERTVRFSYCTAPDGSVVQDPAKAHAKGIALRCYNFR